MELIKKTSIDFLGKRKISFGVSLLLSAMGLICVVMIITGKANMGIDFAGGASANLVFQKPIQVEAARRALDAVGIRDAEIQSFTDGSKLLVRVKKTDIPITQVVDKIKEAFVKAMPDNPVTIDSSAAIGPTVGKALQKDAFWAIVLSFLGIIIYIWIRFEFKFGLAATVATFHDVLAVMGIFWLMHKEITLLVVTALLTLAGYSLTDTVVVFDRIRENIPRHKTEPYEKVVNRSILETLHRSLATQLNAMFVMIAIILFGGTTIKPFIATMLVGMLSETYSSIFVAVPLLVVWEKAAARRAIAHATA